MNGCFCIELRFLKILYVRDYNKPHFIVQLFCVLDDDIFPILLRFREVK